MRLVIIIAALFVVCVLASLAIARRLHARASSSSSRLELRNGRQGSDRENDWKFELLLVLALWCAIAALVTVGAALERWLSGGVP